MCSFSQNPKSKLATWGWVKKGSLFPLFHFPSHALRDKIHPKWTQNHLQVRYGHTLSCATLKAALCCRSGCSFRMFVTLGRLKSVMLSYRVAAAPRKFEPSKPRKLSPEEIKAKKNQQWYLNYKEEEKRKDPEKWVQ